MEPLDDKKADLAGPGTGDYRELEKNLPRDYSSLLNAKDTQKAIFAARNHIEENLANELNLMMVTVPLIVDAESGLNDYLGRDGLRAAVQFQVSNHRNAHTVDAQVLQVTTKWKRMALARLGLDPGEGICTDMRAVRKDCFLDHDHSAYVDQWDWERVITADQRNLDFLKQVARAIWNVLVGAEQYVQRLFPQLKDPRYPNLPEQLTFLHAEEILDLYPDLSPKQREIAVLEQYPAIFIIGIGWRLADGHPHELRSADYDDWVTETKSAEGRTMHGLNGDILVWNRVTRRRHELCSMGIRVDARTLLQQLAITGQMDVLKFPYHQAILRDQAPLTIGGGIGQSRTLMLLLRKAHLGEVSVAVWPKILKEMCTRANIHLLE
jgi:aspartate--ammonia ligase